MFKGVVDTVSTIECGQSVDGMAGDELTVFQFTNGQERNVMFAISNRTFMPILKIKDSADEYVESVTATGCDEADCDDMVFMINGLSSGHYIVEMIPIENDGKFQVEMMCSPQSLGARDGISMSRITPTFITNFKFERLLCILSDHKMKIP